MCIYCSSYLALSHSDFRLLIICVLQKKAGSGISYWYCRNVASRFIDKPLSIKAEVFYVYILHLAFEEESQLLFRVKGNDKKIK